MDSLLATLAQFVAKTRDVKQATMQRLLTGEQRLPGCGGSWQTWKFGDAARPRVERTLPARTPLSEFCVELDNMGQGSGTLAAVAPARPGASLKAVFRTGDVLFGKLRAYLRKFWLADRDGRSCA